MIRKLRIKFIALAMLSLLVVLVVALLAVLYLIKRPGKEVEADSLQAIGEAVRQSALQCYAVEGAYPEDVEYLRENYQLAYDEDRFLVTYIPFAPNVLPTIYITQRGATLN